MADDSHQGDDRRRDRRVDIAVPLHLRLPDLDAVFAGRAINISRSGMYIPLESPPPVGTRVHVDLSAREELLLDATVDVVRRVDDARESGIGVRFVEISFGAEALIERMLADTSLFGDYRIEALLGRGGMAEVYRARDLTSDEAGRIIALKRILPELTRDRHIAKLFRKEAGIARRLHHPNIIQVYDVGEIQNTVYIAMEYVDGCHLGQLITLGAARRVQLPVEIVCQVGRTIADALQLAHSLRDARERPLGLIHRDVTPSNLFVSHAGDIKLGDFGVAMVHGGRGEEAGERVGKDTYSAPEQLLGAPLTPAADVYALGAVLYEVLTQRAAFAGNADDKLSMAPPSVRAVRPDVPEAAARVIARAMSPVLANTSDARVAELARRHPELEPRYQSAAELAGALTCTCDASADHRLAVAAVMRGLFASEQS